MTEADVADVTAARERGREDGAIKKVARRFEEAKVAILEARGVKENMRFDPKLKGQVSTCLLTWPSVYLIAEM
jgi:hypothetical protein